MNEIKSKQYEIIEKVEGLGTIWFIEFFEDIPTDKLDEIRIRLQKELRDFSKIFSRFDEQSLLSELNRDKVLINPPDIFVKTIQSSINYYYKTLGFFDIRIGHLINNLGYDKDKSFVTKEGTTIISDKIENKIILNEDRIELAYDVNIDIGGIGKGIFIDLFFDILINEYNLKYFLINGGGDIRFTSDNGEPIKILLQDPIDRSKYIGEIFLKDKAFGASSPFIRAWKNQHGKTYHHLLDPKKNTSKSNFLTIFTIGNTAEAADVASTSLSVCGTEDVQKIAENLGVEYLAVKKGYEMIKSKGFNGNLEFPN